MPAAPEFRAVVKESRQRLDRLIDQRGAEALKRMYNDAVAELEKKLSALAGRGDTMTAHQQRVLLAQAKIGVAQIERKLGTALGTASREVQTEALRSLSRDITRLEQHFSGAAIPLPIDQAARFRGIIDNRRTSLLQAHESSMKNYGALTVRRMEQELSASLMAGENTHEAVTRLVGVAGGEWWRAERIARTELAWAFNATHADGIKAVAEELPDMMMRWSEHVDDVTGEPLDARVAVDSVAMHGQVAPPDGQFVMPPTAPVAVNGVTEVPTALVGQKWTHPPNRPNDRAVLAPWRPGWGVPGWVWQGGRRTPFKGEISARREAEPVEVAVKPAERPMKPAAISPEQIKAAPRPAHGLAVAADAGDIEGQNVQTRLVRDENGVEHYEFTFKLTAGAGEVARKAMGPTAQLQQFQFKRMTPGKDGVLEVDSKNPAWQNTGESFAVNITHGEKVAGTLEMGTNWGATRNLVRLRVKTSDPKVATAAYEHALKSLGVADPHEVPSPAAVEALRKMQIASKFDPSKVVASVGIAGKRAGNLLPEKVDELWKEIIAAHPDAVKILADSKREEVYFGYDAQRSATQAKLFKDSGVEALIHDSDADEGVIASMLTEDGLMSSSTRYQNGVFTKGMSTAEDFNTGGADGVFTRITRNDRDRSRTNGKFRFIIDPDELGRLDWWAFPCDEYGDAGHNGDVSRRWTTPKMLGGNANAGNEVMFKKGIPPKSIRGVWCETANERDDLLRELRKRGMKEINGVPIDDFVKGPRPIRQPDPDDDDEHHSEDEFEDED
jgi:hypothetical protein